MPDHYQNKRRDKTRDIPRVCIIGLDCADPKLVFDRFADDLPTLSALRRQGIWGPLRSCNPPITIPAWQVMMTGCDPGRLGLYGFRNRADYSYDNLSLATSRSIKEPRIWDLLQKAKPGPSRTADCYSIVLGVPGTYPPSSIQGDMVSGFLAPDTICNFTHPPELADEIRSVVGDYQIDVQNFRTEDKERLISEIHSMTKKRFTLFRHLLQTRPWNFAIMVEMGTDRIHHGFWRYFDQEHRLYEPGNPYENVIRDYYRLIDSEIAETLKIVWGEQNTTVMVVSDHGARALEGGFAFNEWLIREDYLVLKEGARIPKSGSSDTQEESSAESRPLRIPQRIPLEPSMIEWSQTRAWGEGGYYGRLFLNVEGREPQGIVAPDEVESLLTELENKLSALPDDRGNPMGNVVYRPANIYKEEINGIPPDLMVYFGNLAWRSIGTIETVNDRGIIHQEGPKSGEPHSTTPTTPIAPYTPSLHTPENDIGPDDANHDWDGILIAAGSSIQVNEDLNPQGKCIEIAKILDVAPTVLRILEQPVPNSMQGNAHMSASR